ncbi:MAG TPA: nickel-dependent lactate racemase [Acidimicrobiales bacterium]|nr:nickel-dependent lactate racemase [Acidimicrobiales bacterium]
MDVTLAYGEDGLVVPVPDDATVVVPTEQPPLADEAGAVARALHEPVTGPALGELVARAARVVVVFPDLTRPMPNRTVLPPLLAELEALGAGPERVELLCATGTHRQATAAEMADLIGPDLVARYRVHDHRADDEESHVTVGEVDGTAVRVDARYVAADLRICTGFVEPHFFAGYSGGPKAVVPGLAATETILEAHRPWRIADPRATWTVTDGNPVHDFVRAATALCPPQLVLDVAIDRARRLTAVFCGPLPEGHTAACEYVGRHAVVGVDGRFDVVLSTNGGHPLDRNLYQAVKGMAAAERVVVDHGTIVVAAPCGDGVPAGSAFARILAAAERPEDLLAPAGPAEVDRWQAQVLGRILQRADVWLCAEGLTDEEVRTAQLRPVADVGAAVKEALARAGLGGRLCVLPEGPLTVATSG